MRGQCRWCRGTLSTAHIAQSVIQQDFDLTIVNKMDVDRGLTVPALADVRAACGMACRVIPFAVNVVQYPVPSGRRCYNLGRHSATPSNPTMNPSTCTSGAPAVMNHQLQGRVLA